MIPLIIKMTNVYKTLIMQREMLSIIFTMIFSTTVPLFSTKTKKGWFIVLMKTITWLTQNMKLKT